tara:strand:- start:269 stop:925 length:657 start_codon:yes stop_codon:yes gene_type:complete
LTVERDLTQFQKDHFGSMLGQDSWVIEEVYKFMEDGYFVDVGATDGITINNTVALEDEFHWTGICIEPSTHFEELKKNRPNCKLCDLAVFNKTGAIVEFQEDDVYAAGALSGIKEYFDCHQVSGPTFQKETISLFDLLKKYDAPEFIEYLSLDTEGSEFIILENFPFKKYTFGAITVEHNYIVSKRVAIRDLLESNGYIWIKELKEDDCFVHESVRIE